MVKTDKNLKYVMAEVTELHGYLDITSNNLSVEPLSNMV